MNRAWLFLLLLILTAACQQAEQADVVFTNGKIYTVNSDQPWVEALAVKDERIVAIGTADEVAAWQGDGTEVVDLQGAFAMPGFIEGHGHFLGLGESLMNLNFLRSRSWQEIIDAVAAEVQQKKPGEWITGRGWHQEKWQEIVENTVLGYPYHHELSAVSPDNPVILRHASGHGSFANAKAMEIAGVSRETPNPSGGEIVRDSRGEVIGMFEETAQRLITRAYSEYLDSLSEDEREERWMRAVTLAEEECLKNGITSFQDAGTALEDILKLRDLAEKGELDVRLWAMIRNSSEFLQDKLDGFPIINAGNHYFTSRAMKVSIDGALGPFGAWLLESYADKPNFVGQNTTPVPEVENLAKLAMAHGMQFCAHAIGDRANREVLDIFERNFKENSDKKDLRWRIEHAQHLHPDDIPRFGQLGVIASMQGIHCTSDAPFVEKRLGYERAVEGAYVWRSLLETGAVVTNGTDAPVEEVNPFESLYATVTRKRSDTGFEFFPDQKLTREEGIYSYTMACAYSAFEEKDKGSLELGKLADMVVLSKDLLACTDEEILDTEVLMTIVGGNIKYAKE
ncbi:MAG: amidohydrolase [Saprospiraceae bacterium]|nr:amidohydrolase [Saprospiraceae bacterium]